MGFFLWPGCSKDEQRKNCTPACGECEKCDSGVCVADESYRKDRLDTKTECGPLGGGKPCGECEKCKPAGKCEKEAEEAQCGECDKCNAAGKCVATGGEECNMADCAEKQSACTHEGRCSCDQATECKADKLGGFFAKIKECKIGPHSCTLDPNKLSTMPCASCSAASGLAARICRRDTIAAVAKNQVNLYIALESGLLFQAWIMDLVPVRGEDKKVVSVSVPLDVTASRRTGEESIALPQETLFEGFADNQGYYQCALARLKEARQKPAVPGAGGTMRAAS